MGDNSTIVFNSKLPLPSNSPPAALAIPQAKTEMTADHVNRMLMV
jgi:hypothetical protein